MIPANDRFGPWADGLPEPERVARFRALAALVRVYAGPSAAAVVQALRAAESNDNAAEDALAAFDALPAIPKRRALASYAALHRPHQERR